MLPVPVKTLENVYFTDKSYSSGETEFLSDLVSFFCNLANVLVPELHPQFSKTKPEPIDHPEPGEGRSCRVYRLRCPGVGEADFGFNLEVREIPSTCMAKNYLNEDLYGMPDPYSPPPVALGLREVSW